MKRPATLAYLITLVTSCSSSSPSGPVGGAVTGPADEHCGAAGAIMSHKVGMCLTGLVDGGASDGGTTMPSVGETLYNSEGYDDDCKYHVSFTSTPVRLDASVTFTLTVGGLDPAGPVKGASVDAEVYLDRLTPAPNTHPTGKEKSPGVYDFGPVKFDKPGRWTVRFHLFEECSDSNADSPHAHVAFFIDVPSADAGTGG